MRKGYILDSRYQIISCIGEGGMADVYLADDLKKHRKVAIKTLRLDFRDNPRAKRHFKYEQLAITKLHDSHVVKVFDVGKSEGIQYIVMEYVDGDNLKDYIKANYPISNGRIVKIMRQILLAVREAHSHNIIHRDLKPQNILIDKKGNVKITDFGIAIVLSKYSMTQTNSIVGSIHYLSPEQAIGEMATKKSDIYSLGIILYELLTNDVPFHGDTAVAIALQHSHAQMPSPREINDKIPQALENVVLKATAKKQASRYNSVHDMYNDLKSSLSTFRKHEKRFQPIDSEDNYDSDDETKVLDLKDIQSKNNNAEKNKSDVNSPMSRRKKLALIYFSLVCFIVLIECFVFFFFFSRVDVPNVNKLTKNHAEKIIKQKHLFVSKVEYRKDSQVEYNHVIKTTPGEGKSIFNNSGIKLIVSSGPNTLRIKNYVGENIDIARIELKQKGFKVKVFYDYDSNIGMNRIVKQSIKPNTPVPDFNKTIVFIVAKKSSSMM
ncbi:Stk1 family PASTA domain-containing Ser/Thr kinase [Apilactobacillus sp. TMW 2.2459]|uniref:Stk1 family PASTA domain-containing Ser/Thr kinase n=1 Tax=Apilactobacillus xinyiensis TaxID=2841032 RepID=UPI00200CADCF|nr:Stk1 family PASTA domain-containing Ser/Thr kinase [Apilactobacillus xinyiensis]MCL0311756.1 Stk1 family PASTA domain-containing Ser/Thr kinase [Apilactobacillus xinyiensis]